LRPDELRVLLNMLIPALAYTLFPVLSFREPGGERGTCMAVLALTGALQL
jgi:hypothetical protein